MSEINISCTISVPEGPVTFKSLEQEFFKACRAVFLQLLGKFLEVIDERLREARDSERYELKARHERTVETFLGPVRFRRRYYRDRAEGRMVYLLDERLGLESRARIGPWLREMVLSWAVEGPSYRSASGRVKKLVGEQLLSHETVRQAVLEAGEQLGVCELVDAANPEGDRRCRVIFIEVDGVHVPLQAPGRRRRRGRAVRVEPKVAVVYEGWRDRYPGSRGSTLVERETMTFSGDGEDFWEFVSRRVYSRYDLTRDTVVVISGDGAPWVRMGTGYFPQAVYQYSRYHMAKELRNLLGTRHPGLYGRAKMAFLRGDADMLADALMKAAARSSDLKHRLELAGYGEFVLKHRQAVKDYRIQLRELGVDTTGLRGMGAIEGTISLFASRVKGGRAWGKPGLRAMMKARGYHIDGDLWEEVCRAGISTSHALDWSFLDQGAGRRTTRSRSGSRPRTGRLAAAYGPHQGRGWVKTLKAIGTAELEI